MPIYFSSVYLVFEVFRATSAEIIAELIRPAVTYIISLRVLQKIYSPERQICNSSWAVLKIQKITYFRN